MKSTLKKLHNKHIDDEEKALGIVHIKNNVTGIMLRNWVTYKMREHILIYERQSFKFPEKVSTQSFEANFNQSLAQEMKQWMIRLSNEGNLKIFDEVVAHKGILCKKIGEGEYRFQKVFHHSVS